MARTMKKFQGETGAIAARVMTGKEPVNNEQFKNALREYLSYRKSEVDAGRPIPEIPNYIGACFKMIAESLSKKPYFIGYSYREEMVSDALIDCIQYIDKFDPERGTSAFAYFSQTCYYAIVRRIKAEKKQTMAKAAIVQNLGTFFDDIALQEFDEDGQYQNTMSEILKLQNIHFEDGNLKPEVKEEEEEPLEAILPKDIFFDDEENQGF